MNKTYSKSKLEVQKVPTQSLSKALQHNLEDSLTKLSLVQKAIAIIDDVPIRYHCIETLYLSGNFISDLGNIKQFTRLKVLSLANNSLNSIHSLRCLFELTKLQNLCLTSNPLTKHILYRTFLLGGCQQLRILDNVQIIRVNKLHYESYFTTIQQKLQCMMENYWTMEKMCRFARNIDIHYHINQKERCCQLAHLEKYLQLCDLSIQYSQSAKEQLWDSLYEDCVTILESYINDQRPTQEKFIAASEDMLQRQTQKIASLQAKIVKKIHPLDTCESISDSELFERLESKVLTAQKAANCRGLYLLTNVFNTLKRFQRDTSNRINMLYKDTARKTRLNLSFQKFNLKFNQIRRYTLKAAFTILKQQRLVCRSSQKKAVAFKQAIAEQAITPLKQIILPKRQKKETDRYNIIKQKRIRRELLKKYLRMWQEEYQKQLIEHRTRELYKLFEDMKVKEQKYIQKTQLLEQYVEILREQHQRQLTDIQQFRSIKRGRNSQNRSRLVTFNKDSSPYRHENKIFPVVNSPIISYQIKVVERSTLDCGSQNFEFLSETKENEQSIANTAGGMRQRTLNKPNCYTDQIEHIQLRRKEVIDKLKNMSIF